MQSLKKIHAWAQMQDPLCIIISTMSSHWYKNGDEASRSTISAGRGLLVKMLIFYQILNTFKYILLWYRHWCAKRC